MLVLTAISEHPGRRWRPNGRASGRSFPRPSCCSPCTRCCGSACSARRACTSRGPTGTSSAKGRASSGPPSCSHSSPGLACSCLRLDAVSRPVLLAVVPVQAWSPSCRARRHPQRPAGPPPPRPQPSPGAHRGHRGGGHRLCRAHRGALGPRLRDHRPGRRRPPGATFAGRSSGPSMSCPRSSTDNVVDEVAVCLPRPIARGWRRSPGCASRGQDRPPAARDPGRGPGQRPRRGPRRDAGRVGHQRPGPRARGSSPSACSTSRAPSSG